MPKGTKQESQTSDPVEEHLQVEPEEDTGMFGTLMEGLDDAPAQGPDDNPDDDEQEEHEEDTEDEGPEDQEEPEVAPEPRKYKVRGQEYTVEELAKAGLLDDLVTQAGQVAHYQELYHGLKQQHEAVQAQPPQIQAQPQPLRPEQVRAAMAQLTEQAVQGGFVDREFVEDYPNTAATQMYINSDIMQLKQVVAGMYQYFMRDHAERLYNKVKTDFSSHCDTLTTRHAVYANLKKQEEKDRFFDYLKTKVNPEAGAINEEFLGQVYLAFQKEHILPAMQQGSAARKSKKKTQRKLAAGEGGSAPRKDQQHTKQPTVDEMMISGMFDHFNK